MMTGRAALVTCAAVMAACGCPRAAEPSRPAQAVQALSAEVSRAQAVLDVLEARAGERFAPLQVSQAAHADRPWDLVGEYGIAEMRVGASPLPPAVRAWTRMRFSLASNWHLPADRTRIVAHVCRGSSCHERTWPWVCERDACRVDAPAVELLGPDAGRHYLTVVVRATCGEVSHAWSLVAAAAPSM